MAIRTVVVEDHPLMLKAIVDELASQEDIEVVGTATSGQDLLPLLQRTEPDVLVLDLGLEDEFDPLSTIPQLLKQYPHMRILTLTAYENPVWIRSLCAAGVRGYILKHDDLSLNLPQGIRKVYAGDFFYSSAVIQSLLSTHHVQLTEQEIAILQMMAEGLSNACIGQRLGLAESTVRNYCSQIYAKLGIPSSPDIHPRIAAINKAKDMKLL